jgi:RNA polymerase sigma factor (sigma-70 family)
MTINTHPPKELDRDMRLVRSVATAVKRDLAISDDIVELHELVALGYVGLLEARERFDPSRGTDFRRFAHQRIQGAIIDGLRKMTPLPRGVHQQLRLAALAQDDDIQFGDSLEAALGTGRLFNRSGFLIGHSPYPAEPAPDQPSPEELVHQKLRAERVRRIVDELGDPDREVARRRIFEGQSLTVIARELDISRPWIWRVFERACRNIVLSME